MQIITNSEINAFRICPNKWGFRYVELLTTAERASAASWGTLGHDGIRAAWHVSASLKASGQLSMQPDGVSLDYCIEAAQRAVLDKGNDLRLNAEEDQLDEILEQSQQVAAGIGCTVRWMWDAMKSHRLLGTEVPFKLPIADGVKYAGQIDLITYDPELQRIVVWDHKFSASVEAYEGRLQLDTQSCGYVWAVRELQRTGFFESHADAPVGAFVWSVSRRKVPSEPRTNKFTKKAAKELNLQVLLDDQDREGVPMGYVSSASCDTLPHVYLSALVKQEAERFLKRLPEQEERFLEIQRDIHRWYKQEEHFIGDDQIERWKTEALITAEQMRAASKNKQLRIRNPNACANPGSYKCDYDQVCLLDEPETRALYQVRVKKHAEIEESES